MKSTVDQKIEDAFNYAVNFYNTHPRTLDNQWACLAELKRITGLDDESCSKIQNPILSVLMYQETVDIANEVIQHHLNIVTNLLRNRLLELQPTLQTGIVKELPYIPKPPHDYSCASQKDIDNHFVTAYDNSNGRLDINGFCKSGNQAVARTVEHLRYQAEQKDSANGTGHKVLEHKHTLNFSFNLMNDEQTSNLAKFLSWQELNLKELNLSSNNITGNGVETLFYQLRVTPDHLSHSHLRTHNIQCINLSNCNIGDYGANYIAESLKNGSYPATKHIDVSGNGITQTGWEYFATAVKKVQAKTVSINVAIANSLKDLNEFLNKGFKYYTQTHTPVATKEFQDELLGVNISGCDKTRKNVKEAFLTGVAISSLSTGNDVLIFFAGAEAGAGHF